MVSPVRVRVPPLLFSRHFQEKPLDLFAAMLVKCGIHHNCHHNGHSLKALREEVVEAHGCLAMHGGGDVGVGVGGLLHRSVPQHLRDQLQLLPVLEHERGEGVPKVVEPDVRQTGPPRKRFVGAAVEVVVAHDGADSGGEDESKVAPELPVAKPLLVLSKGVREL